MPASDGLKALYGTDINSGRVAPAGLSFPSGLYSLHVSVRATKLLPAELRDRTGRRS